MGRHQPRNYATRSFIVEFIRGYEKEYGRLPSIRQIGEAAGLSSTSTTAGYLNRMVRDGLLGKSNMHNRSYYVIETKEVLTENAG